MTRRAHLGAPGDISVAARALLHYSILQCLYWGAFEWCRLSSGPIDLMTLYTVICVFIMCLTKTFGQKHASAPVGVGGERHFRSLSAPVELIKWLFCVYISHFSVCFGTGLKLQPFSPTHSCFGNSNNRFFTHNKSHQDLCTADYQGELFKAQITTLTPRW